MLLDSLLNNITKRLGDNQDFSGYAHDPVGFCTDVLREQFTDDVQRLMESVRDNPITIGRSANATGKTHAAARAAVWFFRAFPESQVYVAAAPPESNLRRILWSEIRSVIEAHPDLFKRDVVRDLHIERSARSFISGVTIPASGTEAQREAKFSGKHAPALLFIVDEGDAVPSEVFRAIESCLSGGFGRLLCLFNPRSQTGPLWHFERDKRANVIELSALTHPNVIAGRGDIPGAVTRETTVRRINEWCRPLVDGEEPGADCFALPKYLVGATATSQAGKPYAPLKKGHYRIQESAFSTMVLGRYPAQAENQLISRAWIAAARERWDGWVKEHGEQPPSYTPGIGGLDVAELGSDASCLIFRCGGFVEQPIAWGGQDVLQTGDRAARECEGRRISRVCVDATGIGAGVAPHLSRKGITATPVKVASKPTERSGQGEFESLRDQLWWSTREWLRSDPSAMLPPNDMLLEELSAPCYEVTDRGKVRVTRKSVLREQLRRSPDRADSLCLTFAPASAFSDCAVSFV